MKRILLCTLALAAVAVGETYRYRFPGMQTFRWKTGLWNLPYVEECGVSAREWEGMRDTMKLILFRQISESSDEVAIEFSTSLPSDKVEAVMRGLYFAWRGDALQRAHDELSRADAVRQATEVRIAELKKKAAALARDPDAVFDRGRAVQESQTRASSLRTRLVDVRIEHAVAEARARAMRTLIARREDEWKKRQLQRLLRLRKGTNEPKADNPVLKRMIATIEYGEDKDPLALELTAKLTDLEIELVGHEERVKQIRLALEEEQGRRAKLMTTTDLRRIHAQIEQLVATQKSTDRIRHRIAQISKGGPVRIE